MSTAVDPLANVKRLTGMDVQEPESGVVHVYANVFTLNCTETDITLRFGELMLDGPTRENQRDIILERARVTLPWIQAKALAELLGQWLKKYESMNGSLKRPCVTFKSYPEPEQQP